MISNRNSKNNDIDDKEKIKMTLEEKLTLIAETLDADKANIKPEAELKTLDEWDSMGVISTIAMLDKKYNKVLNAEQIDQLKTVQDILDLMA